MKTPPNPSVCCGSKYLTTMRNASVIASANVAVAVATKKVRREISSEVVVFDCNDFSTLKGIPFLFSVLRRLPCRNAVQHGFYEVGALSLPVSCVVSNTSSPWMISS